MTLSNQVDKADQTAENAGDLEEKQYLPLPLYISWVRVEESRFSRFLSLMRLEKLKQKLRAMTL